MASKTKAERGGDHKWIPLGLMRIPPMAQRELRPARVDALVSEFDLEHFGIPTVSHRGDHYYVLDGQHRIEAIKRWLGDNWEGQHVECYVYEGLSEKDEAEKFDRLNNALAVNDFDRFRIRVNAGREVETKINDIVEKTGLRVSRDQVDGAIRAVGTLRRVYLRSDGETLAKSLRIIRDSYGDSGLKANVIDGVGRLCQRYNGALDEDIAVDRLSKVHGGVSGLLSKAEVLHKQTGNPKGECVAAAAVDIINSKRSGKRLASWWRQG